MVAAVSSTINSKTAQAATARTHIPSRTRRPLLPSETDNALALRRPKSREVTSRYMSSSSTSVASKRCASPLISRPASMMTPAPSTPAAIKRSQSVERRRAATPRPTSLDLRNGNGNDCEVSNMQKILITSTRSLSVSFQGESFTFQVSKAKPAPSPISARRSTQERRKAAPTPTRGGEQAENSKLMEQQRWPGRLRQPDWLSRSINCCDDRRILTGSEVNTNVFRTLQNSTVDNRSSTESSRSSSDSWIISSEKPVQANRSDSQSDPPVVSDTESVSSGTTAGSNGNTAGSGQQGPLGVIVPGRLWQETNNKLHHQTDHGSPPSRTNGLKVPAPSKLMAPKEFGFDSPMSFPNEVVNNRGLSPICGGQLRHASPSKFGTPLPALSPMKGVSPSRVRNAGGTVNSNFSNVNNTPSILSFVADVRRGKIGQNKIVEVHFLRILYNRLLQWRFVNARADTALSAQRSNAEKSLHNAQVTTSQLLESVRAKRTELQCLRQNLKLISILNGQMMYLEELVLMDHNFSHSLSGAIESLRASTLRLPVVGGARADVQNVKDAICSAVDVMQAMGSSICSLLSKVGEVNTLVAELGNTTAKESALLHQCKDLLSNIAAMQVKECSLRTHILQVNHVPTGLTTKV